MKISKRLNYALAMLLLSGNIMCSHVDAFEYEWITKGQAIDNLAKESLQRVENCINSKDENRYRTAVKALQSYIRRNGSFYSKSDFNKESKYAILYHFSLACYLGELRLPDGLSYTTLNEIINDTTDTSPWVKQIRCLSQLLKGFNMARIFSMVGNRDASNLRIAESLLRPFIAAGNKKELLQYYLKLLGTTDKKSLGKFQTIVGESKDSNEICQKIDAYARYYLGVVLFCLSPVQKADVDEIANILNPIENSPFLSDKRRDLINVITALLVGRKASQSETGSETPEAVAVTSEEVECVLNLSDADFEVIRTLQGEDIRKNMLQPRSSASSLGARASKASSGSVSPALLLPTPSRPVPTIPVTTANSKTSGSSSGSVPPPPPPPPPLPLSAASSSSGSDSTTVPSKPKMSGNLLEEIQKGFKIKKTGFDPDKAREEKRQAIKESLGSGSLNPMLGGLNGQQMIPGLNGPLRAALAKRRAKITGSEEDSDDDSSDSDWDN